MLKIGEKGELVRELQGRLLDLGYDLPKYGADGDFGSETVSAVSQFKQELIDLLEEEGVSRELQRLIDALVSAEWKRPPAKPEITPEEIEEIVSAIYDAFSPLQTRSEETEHVRSLQTALKRLGFYHGKIDGIFGNGTRRSLQAAQHELEIEATGEVDDQTAEAIKELLRQAESGERWKLPRRTNPNVEVPEDQSALYRSIMEENGIPPYFAEALAEQEAGSDHFDEDGFVKIRCEFWSQYPHDEKEHQDYEIRYRSYGIMQLLDLGHPEDLYTRGSEVGNITNKELRESVAKNIEAGAHLLRSLLTGAECIYDDDDERHYQCKDCIREIETVERDWSETRFHRWRSEEVPSFDQIPCGWAEAIRRYNGSGADAEAYRDEILTRITGVERT